MKRKKDAFFGRLNIYQDHEVKIDYFLGELDKINGLLVRNKPVETSSKVQRLRLTLEKRICEKSITMLTEIVDCLIDHDKIYCEVSDNYLQNFIFVEESLTKLTDPPLVLSQYQLATLMATLSDYLRGEST